MSSNSLWIGSSKFEANESFNGKISCFQLFAKSLNPSQIKSQMNCKIVENLKKRLCDNNYYYIDGKCILLPDEKLTYMESQIYCMPFSSSFGNYDQRLFHDTNLHTFSIIGEFLGTSEDVWIGIDNLNGSFTDSFGNFIFIIESIIPYTVYWNP